MVSFASRVLVAYGQSPDRNVGAFLLFVIFHQFEKYVEDITHFALRNL